MADRKTIGVTSGVASTLRDFVERSEFNDEVDVARVAVILAMRQGNEVPEVSGATTKWNVGTFDPTGELKIAVNALHPEIEEPYRYIEGLLHQGAIALTEHLKNFDGLDLEALLEA